MNRKVMVVICGLVLVGALVSIWLTSRTKIVRLPKEEVIGVPTGLGQALGEATVKVVPAYGQVAVVVPRPFAQFKEQSPYLWRAFAGELEKHNLGLTIEEIDINAWNNGLPVDERVAFQAVLDRHINKAALVFFVDLPFWGGVQESLRQYTGPPLIALIHLSGPLKGHYGGFFENKILSALIAAPAMPLSATKPKTPREWFDKYYKVYTPQNFETLPE